jgi:CheY-like chemotaxis protein
MRCGKKAVLSLAAQIEIAYNETRPIILPGEVDMASLIREPILIRDIRQRERLEALCHLAVELSALRDLEAVLNTALRHCLDLTESRFGFIGLLVSVQKNHIGHLGLMGMQERAESLGGQLAIQSSPGFGTRVALFVPIHSFAHVRPVPAAVAADSSAHASVLEIVGEADNGSAALQQAADLMPHVVLLDIRMPGETGVDLVERMRQIAPLRERVEALDSRIVSSDYVSLENEAGEAMLAELLGRRRADGVRLVILAGETAIMDRHDIAPRAVERAGGCVESVGAPVDPGNLLMLAYLDDMPIIGAPGCARSRKINIVDWVLPRLIVGDRLARADVVALGHGGLLEDAPERPMPRDLLT